MANVATGTIQFNQIFRRGETKTVSIPLPEGDFKGGSLSFDNDDVFVFGTDQQQAYTIFKNGANDIVTITHKTMDKTLVRSGNNEGINMYGAYLELRNIWIEGYQIKLEFLHNNAQYSRDYEDLNCYVGWEVHK